MELLEKGVGLGEDPGFSCLAVQMVRLSFLGGVQAVPHFVLTVPSNETLPGSPFEEGRLVVETQLEDKGALVLPVPLSVFDEAHRPDSLADVFPRSLIVGDEFYRAVEEFPIKSTLPTNLEKLFAGFVSTLHSRLLDSFLSELVHRTTLPLTKEEIQLG